MARPRVELVRIDYKLEELRLDLNCLESTDHELIPARNASLAAMQGSASGINVR
jgi:hypothetical protein